MDFEKTETEVTIIHNFRHNCDPDGGRRVRVVFECEMYDTFSAHVERSGQPMEDELDRRLLTYFIDLENYPGDAGKIGRQRGIKSVTYLDKLKKSGHPVLS